MLQRPGRYLCALSLPEWRLHPWRHMAVALAVAVGVALAFSVHLINASALSEFAGAVRAANGEPDLTIAARTREGFDDALIESLVRDETVRVASPVVELGDHSVAVEIDAPMRAVHQLVIDLDRRPEWLKAVERLDRPATTERIGLRHVCIFHGLTVEWETVKSEIGDDEILYVEEGRIVEKDLPARASFVIKRLGERRTFLRFHAKWLSGPEPPREGVSEFLCARRSETCPRRRSSLATNDRRGGQVGATYYAAVLVNRSA